MIVHIFEQSDGTFRTVTWAPDAVAAEPSATGTLRYQGEIAAVPQTLRDEIAATEPPPPPNGTGFRTAIAQVASYQNWVDSLPQHRAISLAISAANDNWAEVQAIYNAAVAITPPVSGARAEWQAIAAANHIPLDFGSD